MNPSVVTLLDSPWMMVAFAAFIYALLLAFARGIVGLAAVRPLAEQTHGRIGALDGLRGILAIGVFVHHCALFYFFENTGGWHYSSNPIVLHLGQSCVALFFMITGFLFMRKTQSAPLDWGAFLLGRMARLGPLYVLAVSCVVVCVFGASGWTLHEGPLRVVEEVATWLAFGCFGLPDIDAYPQTFVIIAGVNWSLRYEVLFYLFGVPTLFAINRFLAPPIALACSAFSIVILLILHRGLWLPYGDTLFALHFLGGVAVACAYAIPKLWRHVETRGAHWIAALATVALAFTPDARQIEAYLATLVVFAAVVGNASLFGLLRTRSAVWLGDISYGVYLLHGLVLWCAYRLGLGPTDLPGFLAFSALVGAIVVTIATTSYLLLELPVMRHVRSHRAGSTLPRSASFRARTAT